MWRDIVIGAVLVIATLAVFAPVKDFKFTQYDDRDDVWGNRHINTGLSAENAWWAFSATERANWIPLTRLSNQLDFTLFPQNEEGHEGRQHLVNVWLHALNALLLYLVLRRLTAAYWASGVVAALFALHPLHVESVAWIVERKDVLSTLFWLLTMGAYVLYAQRRDGTRWAFYGLTVLGLALGLAAKPMLVTLPFVLLLLDFWPLRRLDLGLAADEELRLDADNEEPAPRPPAWAVLLEKVPLLLLAAASCFVTYWVQQKGGAMAYAEKIDFPTRLAHVPVAYVTYLVKTFWPAWPFDLAVFYPFHDDFSRGWAAAAAGLLAAITALVLWQVRRRPYLAVGWFWYLGTLVPVIGLVKVGLHSVADRYTYVPLVGIFIMVVWGAADLLARWRLRWAVLGPAAAAAIVACGVLTTYQLPYWQNTYTLFERDIHVVGENSVAYYNMGDESILAGRFREAIDYYKKALDQDPTLSGVHNNVGWAYTRLAQDAQNRARQAQGAEAEALAREARDDLQEADRHYHKSLELDPKNASTHNNLGLALYDKGKVDEALQEYLKAIELEPKFAAAHNNLGLVLMQRNEMAAAADHFRTAIRLEPSLSMAHKNLGQILIAQGDWREGRDELQQALAQNPAWTEVNLRLARLEATCPDGAFRNGPDAVDKAQRALAQSPPNFLVLDTLAAAYAEAGRFDLAAQAARQAIQAAADQKGTGRCDPDSPGPSARLRGQPAAPRVAVAAGRRPARAARTDTTMNDTPQTSQERWQNGIIIAALIVLVLAVYIPVRGYHFLNYDDPGYIFDNGHVTYGLTCENFVWAFTSTYQTNWQPLVWLSYMLDVSLFGAGNAGAHHLVNVALHMASTILLFLVLARMTRRAWPSVAVAALFAVHPLHVESVAWIAERKDVLSALFWMLTMGAYVHYAERPGVARYLPVFACLALGLMAKPMLVTLPLVLLLLDFWPLAPVPVGAAAAGNSLRAGDHRAGSSRVAGIAGSPPSPLWLILLEKVPLLGPGGGLVHHHLHDPARLRGHGLRPDAHVGPAAVVGDHGLRRLHRQDGLAHAPGGHLSLCAPLADPAGAGGRLRPGPGDGGGRPPGAAQAVPGGRLALVPGHAGAGHRDRPGGPAVDGRPVHLRASDWPVHRRRVPGGRPGGKAAVVRGPRRHPGRRRADRPGGRRLHTGYALEGQREPLPAGRHGSGELRGREQPGGGDPRQAPDARDDCRSARARPERRQPQERLRRRPLQRRPGAGPFRRR